MSATKADVKKAAIDFVYRDLIESGWLDVFKDPLGTQRALDAATEAELRRQAKRYLEAGKPLPPHLFVLGLSPQKRKGQPPKKLLYWVIRMVVDRVDGMFGLDPIRSGATRDHDTRVSGCSALKKALDEHQKAFDKPKITMSERRIEEIYHSTEPPPLPTLFSSLR